MVDASADRPRRARCFGIAERQLLEAAHGVTHIMGDHSDSAASSVMDWAGVDSVVDVDSWHFIDFLNIMDLKVFY